MSFTFPDPDDFRVRSGTFLAKEEGYGLALDDTKRTNRGKIFDEFAYELDGVYARHDDYNNWVSFLFDPNATFEQAKAHSVSFLQEDHVIYGPVDELDIEDPGTSL